MLLITIAQTGCSTMSALGLPFGSSNNKILESAQAFSDAPGKSLLIPKELAKAPLDTYLVEIGDTILIEPVNFDATIRLPGDQVIQPDGFVAIGEFGRYPAMNKPLYQIRDEVQSMINDHLRQHLEVAYELERRQAAEDKAFAMAKLENDDKNIQGNAQEDLSLNNSADREQRVALERRIEEAITQNEISVRLVSWESKRVYVLGEVNSPGSFTYSGAQTVLDAILEAGGLSARANRHQIIVARPSTCSDCRTVIKVCYDQIVQLGDASTNYQLQPGDRVFVPSLTFCDDLKKSIGISQDNQCPRCSGSPRPCLIPTGCE